MEQSATQGGLGESRVSPLVIFPDRGMLTTLSLFDVFNLCRYLKPPWFQRSALVFGRRKTHSPTGPLGAHHNAVYMALQQDYLGRSINEVILNHFDIADPSLPTSERVMLESLDVGTSGDLGNMLVT